MKTSNRRTRTPRRLYSSLERLEERRAPAAFVVNTTADGPNSGATVTLRGAILEANANPDSTITFDIPGAGPFVIYPTSPLPTISAPMTIDGMSQPGTPPNTPGIQVDGSHAGQADGFHVAAGHSTLEGLIITDFSTYGVRLYNAGNDLVYNCCIGIDHYGGEHAAPNGAGGVLINNVPNNTVSYCVVSGNIGFGIALTGSNAKANSLLNDYVGVSKSGDHAIANRGDGILVVNGVTQTNINSCLVSGNTGNGIEINGPMTTSNTVTQCLIGTDYTGLSSLPNMLDGVSLSAPNNTIGGPTLGPTVQNGRNIISGNIGNGIDIIGPFAQQDQIFSNYIGLGINGANAVPNQKDGILLNGSPMDNIGDGTAANRNVISANMLNGIEIAGAKSVGDHVYGNYIGTDLNGTRGGTQSYGNMLDGVLINGAPSAMIGGTGTGQGNTISENGKNGIELMSAGARNAMIQANIIGLDATGKTILGNQQSGIFASGAIADTIGGNTAAAGNVISGNQKDGIDLVGGSTTGFKVFGNIIGLDITGKTAKANLLDGISLNGSPGNQIGAQGMPANVISGNMLNGISISGPSATGNFIQLNRIGTDATGLTAVGNQLDGINLLNAPNNNIGGPGASLGNIISGNLGNGIDILGGAAAGNTIAGNAIGVDINRVIAVANMKDGILISGAPGTIIGIPANADPNVISGNTKNGIEITSGAKTKILGNMIGTNRAGVGAIANGGDGVLLSDAPSTRVGGVNAADGNVVSGNGGDGVAVMGAMSAKSLILGNLIGTNAFGVAALANGGDGVAVSAAPMVAVGFTFAGAGNVISGNGGNGVRIAGDDSQGDLVLGNEIGTQKGGVGALGNGLAGVLLDDGPLDCLVGSKDAGGGNVICANAGAGVEINGDSVLNEVVNNSIGIDSAGAKLGNGLGVWIHAGANLNIVGGARAGTANVISGNTGDGILIEGAGSDSNEVASNFIGTNAAGGAGLGNGGDGVHIQAGASFNQIGLAGFANVISGNGASGVDLNGAATAMNKIFGNSIGTDPANKAVLANGGDGVIVTAGVSNQISYNMIAGNTRNGVELVGNAMNNLVSNNGIGSFLAKLPNGVDGVVVNASTGSKIYDNGIYNNFGNGIQVIGASNFTRIFGNSIGGALGAGNLKDGIDLNGATGVLIGSPINGDDNTISDNGGDGIGILAGANKNVILGNEIARNATGINIVNGNNNKIGGVGENIIHNNLGFGVGILAGTGNLISRNSIFGDGGLGIDLKEDGVTPNHAGFKAGPNNFQNYPVVTAVRDGKSVRVDVSLQALPNNAYVVEFFTNKTAGLAGYGEGETYLTQRVLNTNADGLASTFFHSNALTLGSIITATATDNVNDTSEFSKAATVVNAPPEVTGSHLVLSGNKVSEVVLSFSEGLLPSAAQNIRNYALDLPDSSGAFTVPVPIKSATYNAVQETVTLVPKAAFTASEFVNIFASEKITDLGGLQLAGQFDKQFPTGATPPAASNFSILEEDAANITYNDSAGNHVSVDLQNGGIIELIRSINGQGRLVSLLNTIAGQSVLTGSVTQGGSGNGTTTLTAIYGLGSVTDNLPASFIITG